MWSQKYGSGSDNEIIDVNFLEQTHLSVPSLHEGQVHPETLLKKKSLALYASSHEPEIVWISYELAFLLNKSKSGIEIITNR